MPPYFAITSRQVALAQGKKLTTIVNSMTGALVVDQQELGRTGNGGLNGRIPRVRLREQLGFRCPIAVVFFLEKRRRRERG